MKGHRRAWNVLLIVSVALVVAPAGSACPVCNSDNGLQVRELVKANFLWTLAATSAPFPVFALSVAAVRKATPWLVGRR